MHVLKASQRPSRKLEPSCTHTILRYLYFNTHTHASIDVASGGVTGGTTEPPYRETLLYYPTSGAIDIPNGLIAMFDTTPLPANWTSLSGGSGAYENMFIKPAATSPVSFGLLDVISFIICIIKNEHSL